LIFAIESGTASAPYWVGVLDVASSWNVPPWEIAKGSKTLWYMRQKALNEELRKPR